MNFVDDTYRVTVNALPWRGYPQFVGAVLVAVDRPIGQMGNYHLAAGANSPVDNGRASAAAIGGPSGTVAAPAIDIDDQNRPAERRLRHRLRRAPVGRRHDSATANERDKDHTHARYQSSVAAASSLWAERPSQPARSGVAATLPPPGASCSPSDRCRRRRGMWCTSPEPTAGSQFPAPAAPTSYDFPDNLAPEGKTTYVFGFRDVTGYSDQQVQDQKGKTQICAPLLWFDEYQAALANDVQVTVTNLGMQVRPDLTDGHTLHWHGFRNAAPFYDGVPEMSVSIPIGRDLTYFYQPKDPGTYMYHCHFEDVEHVQMGMTGPLFVRPRQNGTVLGGFNKFAYNDGDGSTGYDREFALLLTEMYLESHWQDAHIQQPLWDQYHADAWFINGRSYPDTLEPTTGFYGPTGSRPTGIAVGTRTPGRTRASPRRRASATSRFRRS